MKKVIVLFSGGLDSTTCLALAASRGYECYALSFSYGQKHSIELEAAKKIAASFKAQHLIMDLPISQYQHSALTDQNIDIPHHTGSTQIPVTYVPARNTIFLAFALGWAETLNAKDIFIGVSHIDYSGYPDCRPEFIQAFQRMANLATKMGVEEGNITIHAPLINLSKAETIKMGLELGIDYRITISCYQADNQGKACGYCDSCTLRKQGFLIAGVVDPTSYQS